MMVWVPWLPRGVVGRVDSVVVRGVDRVLLPVRGGMVLLKPGPIGVELRVVGMLVVLGRPLDLKGAAELGGLIDEELLNRMLELGVELAGVENSRDEEVDVLGGGPKHSVTVVVTVARGQLLIVIVV